MSLRQSRRGRGLRAPLLPGFLLAVMLACSSGTARALQPVSIAVSPSTVYGGTSVQATVTLDGNAPMGGQAVTISWSPGAAASLVQPPLTSYPASGTVTVPAGQSAYTFTVYTSIVARQRVIPFTAAIGSASVQTSPHLTLKPINLVVSNMEMPDKVTLSWDMAATGMTLKRDSTTLVASLGGSGTYTDTFAFTDGQVVMYTIYNGSTLVAAERVALYKKTVTANQTADSRRDLRYPDPPPVYQDFQFGNRIFRGGLYAGLANDNSKVGRSFLRWNDITASGAYSNSVVRVGNIHTYFTGAHGTQTVTIPVGMQVIGATGWDPLQLKWTTAPAITPSQGVLPVTGSIVYNPASPVFGWVTWNFADAIEFAIANGGALGTALASRDEMVTGWAYFAKKEFNSTKAPTATYAWVVPTLIDLKLNPTTIQAGATASTATINVNGIELNEVAQVEIAIEPYNNGTLPTLSLSGGAYQSSGHWYADVTGWGRTFMIQAASGPAGATRYAIIRVTYGPRTATALLTVTYP